VPPGDGGALFYVDRIDFARARSFRRIKFHAATCRPVIIARKRSVGVELRKLMQHCGHIQCTQTSYSPSTTPRDAGTLRPVGRSL